MVEGLFKKDLLVFSKLFIGFESLFLFSEAFSVYNEYIGACGSGKEYI